MAQRQEQAQAKKQPGKNMLWGGRFTGSFLPTYLLAYLPYSSCRCYEGKDFFLGSRGDKFADEKRIGLRWDGSSYGMVYTASPFASHCGRSHSSADHTVVARTRSMPRSRTTGFSMLKT